MKESCPRDRILLAISEKVATVAYVNQAQRNFWKLYLLLAWTGFLIAQQISQRLFEHSSPRALIICFLYAMVAGVRL